MFPTLLYVWFDLAKVQSQCSYRAKPRSLQSRGPERSLGVLVIPPKEDQNDAPSFNDPYQHINLVPHVYAIRNAKTLTSLKLSAACMDVMRCAERDCRPALNSQFFICCRKISETRIMPSCC